MHNMSRAREMTLLEVLVEDSLYAVLTWRRGHAEDSFRLLDDDEVFVFVDYLDVLVQQLCASLVTAH